MLLKDALTNEVNSASLSYENHMSDNGFIDSDPDVMRKELMMRKFEAEGISKEVPFRRRDGEISFAFSYEGENYWCHFPLITYSLLLRKLYGKERGEELVRRICKEVPPCFTA